MEVTDLENELIMCAIVVFAIATCTGERTPPLLPLFINCQDCAIEKNVFAPGELSTSRRLAVLPLIRNRASVGTVIRLRSLSRHFQIIHDYFVASSVLLPFSRI